MRLYLMGRHSHRTPLSYNPYRNLIKNRITLVENPLEADAIIFSYVINIDESAEEIATLRGSRPDLRLIIISEEPLWDTTNSGDFCKRHNIRLVGDYSFPYSVINHHTSNLYEFIRFPYFLTTDDKFFLRYSHAFSQNIKFTEKDLIKSWSRAPVHSAFFAESRELAKKYSVKIPEVDTWGLSVYRTDVAKAVPNAGTLRVGQGWGAQITRQDLPDWHLDKLVTLGGKSKIVSAIENTSQYNYISEKIFDAFSARALPLYWAPVAHRVHELAPEGSFLNLFGLEPADAAQRISTFEFNEAYAALHMNAQLMLRERFRYYDDYISERVAFTKRLTKELEDILAEAEKESI